MTTTTLRKQPTLDEFKSWAKDCAPAAKAVLMAQAFSELERERVDAYIQPLLESYQFTTSAKYDHREAGKPITDVKWIYLSDDEPMVAAFFADCDKAHRAHGFTGPDGHCPALRAENLLIQAQNALIGLAEPLFGIEVSDLYGDKRAKYLELLIGACLKESK